MKYLVVVKEWLKLPEARDLDIDDSYAAEVHAKIIKEKTFLRNLYKDFYNQFLAALPKNIDKKIIVEIGSGGGFIKEVIPNVITSDVAGVRNVDKNFSVLKMPFTRESVDFFLMQGVFHHVPDAEGCFQELDRCLKPKGKIIMIEPANTLWAKYIWPVNGEDFDPQAGWSFKGKGRLSTANGALPWIVLSRDRKQFEEKFPALKIRKMEPHTPFRYLLSGGMYTKQLLPSFMHGFVKSAEFLLKPCNKFLGMFMTIEIEKEEGLE